MTGLWKWIDDRYPTSARYMAAAVVAAALTEVIRVVAS